MKTAEPVFELRPARAEDFDFAWALYRESMKALTEELLEWHEAAQKAVVAEALGYQGAAIVVVNGSPAGWLLATEGPAEIYIGQLFIVPELQNQGIGTALVSEFCRRARGEGKTVALKVMRNNRARVLYRRLGFRIAGRSGYKPEMRWTDESGKEPEGSR